MKNSIINKCWLAVIALTKHPKLRKWLSAVIALTKHPKLRKWLSAVIALAKHPKLRKWLSAVIAWLQKHYVAIIVIVIAIIVACGVLWWFDWGVDCKSCENNDVLKSEYTRNQALILFGVLTPIFVIWGRLVAMRQNALTKEQNELTILRDNTNQYVEGVKLIHAATIPEKMAGLYSLHNLMKQDTDRDFTRVIDVLCDWVRENTKNNTTNNELAHNNTENVTEAPPEYNNAIQLALDIITNREDRFWTEEHKIIAKGKHKDKNAWPNLSYCNLQQAKLEYANLQGANLRGAYLQRAYLQNAKLQRSSLSNAYLQRAYLQRTHLQGAHLQGANLQGAYLQYANLQGVEALWAKLEKAKLEKANLEGAKLSEAAHITKEQILEAIWKNQPPSLNHFMECDPEIKKWLKDPHFNKKKW